MLRQVHVFHKGEHIYHYSYAMALGDAELTNVIKIIQSFIEMPMTGKTLQRPADKYQIFHRTTGNTLFLFITDLVDTLEYVGLVLEKTINKFNELFSNSENVSEVQFQDKGFLTYLESLQKEIHSKITIIGPVNSGKTALYDMLRSDEERPIMNFAKSSSYLIDNIQFDLWDFQLKDNFSLLWPKFVSGSDLIILMFDLSNYHLKVIDHFLNLHSQDSKFSRILILGNKRDLVDEEVVKIVKNELNLSIFEEISLVETGAKEQINQLISKELGIRKPLPDNFEQIKGDAEKLESEGNLVLAGAKYKELINICNTYQDFTYVSSFKQKLEAIQQKLNAQIKQRKDRESRKKFESPGKIEFTRKIQVKSLPSEDAKEQPSERPKLEKPKIFVDLTKPETPEEKVEDLTLFDKSNDKSQQQPEPEQTEMSTKPTLKPDDIKGDLKVTLLTKSTPLEEDTQTTDFSTILQDKIAQKGSSLSVKLCEQLITELQKALDRPLTYEDIDMAAEVFVKQENL